MARELLGKEEKLRIMVASMRSDLGFLQIAMLKESKHDIAQYLSSALQRSEELIKIMNDWQILRTQ